VKIDSERKERIALPSISVTEQEMDKEKKDELVKPTAPADSAKDTGPK
jgi:hypothetical protein